MADGHSNGNVAVLGSIGQDVCRNLDLLLAIGVKAHVERRYSPPEGDKPTPICRLKGCWRARGLRQAQEPHIEVYKLGRQRWSGHSERLV